MYLGQVFERHTGLCCKSGWYLGCRRTTVSRCTAVSTQQIHHQQEHMENRLGWPEQGKCIYDCSITEENAVRHSSLRGPSDSYLAIFERELKQKTLFQELRQLQPKFAGQMFVKALDPFIQNRTNAKVVRFSKQVRLQVIVKTHAMAHSNRGDAVRTTERRQVHPIWRWEIPASFLEATALVVALLLWQAAKSGTIVDTDAIAVDSCTFTNMLRSKGSYGANFLANSYVFLMSLFCCLVELSSKSKWHCTQHHHSFLFNTRPESNAQCVLIPNHYCTLRNFANEKKCDSPRDSKT